jgi:hypothetical protein
MLEESKTPGVADEGVKDLCKYEVQYLNSIPHYGVCSSGTSR